MKLNPKFISIICVVALMVLLSSANSVSTQSQPSQRFLSEDVSKSAPHGPMPLPCTGPISRVVDVGDERVRFTPSVFPGGGGGGEGGCFDPTPLLSTTVALNAGVCLNAHLSAIVGSRQTYGVASMTLFQVTLTPTNGGPRQHLVGHYETPFGIACPAVALEAETDVDTWGSNFFQRVGSLQGDVPPGVYQVDVWWAGGPGGGGAIGAAFVLKLYLR